jgi:hypothetical protein
VRAEGKSVEKLRRTGSCRCRNIPLFGGFIMLINFSCPAKGTELSLGRQLFIFDKYFYWR